MKFRAGEAAQCLSFSLLSLFSFWARRKKKVERTEIRAGCVLSRPSQELGSEEGERRRRFDWSRRINKWTSPLPPTEKETLPDRIIHSLRLVVLDPKL